VQMGGNGGQLGSGAWAARRRRVGSRVTVVGRSAAACRRVVARGQPGNGGGQVGGRA
jgi:hypothetical protein